MRNDIHSPKNFNIDDYTVIDFFGVIRIEGFGDRDDKESYGDEAREAYFAQEDGGAGNPHPELNQCDLCGTWFNHGAVLKHNPTGRMISIGGQCMTTIAGLKGLTDGEKLYRAKVNKSRRERVTKMRALLASTPGINAALKVNHYITKDLRAKVLKFGDLSEKQVALALKIAREEAAKPAELAPVAVPVTDKRIRVRGRILGLKEQPGFAYGQTITKMLVQVEAEGGAYKLFGTLPSAVYDACFAEQEKRREAYHAKLDEAKAQLKEAGADEAEIYKTLDAIPAPTNAHQVKGLVIEFTAKIEPSSKDPNFGFISRPTKVEVISWPA